MRTPLQQLAPSFTSARAYRDWKNGPVLLDPEDVIALVLASVEVPPGQREPVALCYDHGFRNQNERNDY